MPPTPASGLTGCLVSPHLHEGRRVDPKGAGHVFLVHGQACVKTSARPQCTWQGGGAPPAKMFHVDVRQLMAGDWRVGGLVFVVVHL